MPRQVRPAAIDLARSILRRAERSVVTLQQTDLLREGSEVIPYLNRAADLLFILARYQDRDLSTELLNGDG